MTDAQEALDEYSSVTCTDHLDSFAHNHHPTIERALRLLAAVEAGTHKVVPMIAHWKQLEDMVDVGMCENKSYDDIYNAALQAAPDFFAEDGK